MLKAFRIAVVEQSGHHETLSLAQFHVGFGAARRNRGNHEAVEGHAIGRIQSRNFLRQVQLDGVVSGNHRSEPQANAKFAELDGHRSRVAAALQNRHRELAAHQEVGFLAVGGHQIRLGQNLQNIFGLQRLQESPQIQLGIEGEDVQRRRDRTAYSGAPGPPLVVELMPDCCVEA